MQGVCESCNGTMAEPGSKIEECTTCGGQGRVRANNGLFQFVQECPKCGGRGTIVQTPCKTCSGRGTQSARKRQEFE